MTKILVTTDTSDLGYKALPHAQNLAQALGAELVVLGIHPDPTPVAVEGFVYAPPISAEDLAEEVMQMRRDIELHAPGVRVLVEYAAARPVWQAILEAATTENAQMVVMSTHGRKGLSRVFLGSVAEEVVQNANIPVMLVHGEQPVTAWK